MAIWQIGLLLLGAVWLLQAAGTWLQMRHYREVMSSIGGKWTDGYLGVGNARASLGRGRLGPQRRVGHGRVSGFSPRVSASATIRPRARISPAHATWATPEAPSHAQSK